MLDPDGSFQAPGILPGCQTMSHIRTSEPSQGRLRVQHLQLHLRHSKDVRAAGDSHPPLHSKGRNPPAPSRSLKLPRFNLVRQYDLPSYGIEELEVDYAFVNFHEV